MEHAKYTEHTEFYKKYYLGENKPQKGDLRSYPIDELALRVFKIKPEELKPFMDCSGYSNVHWIYILRELMDIRKYNIAGDELKEYRSKLEKDCENEGYEYSPEQWFEVLGNIRPESKESLG